MSVELFKSAKVGLIEATGDEQLAKEIGSSAVLR